MTQFYTYIYLDTSKILPEPFYVGKGKNSRAYDHLKEAQQSTKNTHKLNKIRKILEKPNDLHIKIINTQSEDEAYELEEFLVSEIGCLHIPGFNVGPLTNQRPGGLGGRSDMATVKDDAGATFIVHVNDPRYLSGELVGAQSKTVTVKDKHGNKSRVPEDSEMYLSGDLVGVNMGISLNHPNKSLVEIYDSNNNLVHSVTGSFFKFCKQYNLPTTTLQWSYKNDGKPIYCGKYGKGVLKSKNLIFKGWYAIKPNLKHITNGKYRSRKLNC